MTTQNTITIASKDNVLIVPTITLNTVGDKNFVYTLEAGNKVVEKEVMVGLSDSMNTEIISGLKEGEKVISAQMASTEITAASSKNTRMRL